MSGIYKIIKKTITVMVSLALAFTMINGNQINAQAKPVTGKVIHFTVKDGNDNPVEGATVTVTYQREGIDYVSIVTTDSTGKTEVSVINNSDEKTFNYSVSKAGYGTVTGARSEDDHAWGANIGVNLGGLQSYNVTFNYSNDFAGTPLTSTVTVQYGQSAALLAPDAGREGYTFGGWDGSLDNITGNVTVNALYTIRIMNVTFNYSNDFTGTPLSQILQIIYGQSAQEVAPDPAREGYNFLGWDIPLLDIRADVTANAGYQLITNNLTFNYSNDFAGTALSSTVSVGYGQSGSGQTPNTNRTGYTFIGWDASIDNIRTATTVNAIYRINDINVTYVFLTSPTTPETAVASIHYNDNLLINAPGAETTNFETTNLRYRLTGWFYDQQLTLPVTEEDLLQQEGNIVLYGSYKIDSISYFYVLNPGLHIQPAEGNYGPADFTNGIKIYGALDINYDGQPISDTGNPENGLPAGTLNIGPISPESFTTAAGTGTVLPADSNIIWYMVKTADGVWNVLGYITDQIFTKPVTVNFYQDSIAGTLLGTLNLNAPETAFTAADGGLASILGMFNINTYRTAASNAGIVESFNTNTDVINIVYVTTPATVVTPPVTTATPAATPPATALATITEAALPLAAAPLVTINEAPAPLAATPLAATVGATAPAEATIIPDEATPEAASPASIAPATPTEPEVTIQEAEVPKAVLDSDCYIHWIILIITLVYTGYAVVRMRSRSKRIDELQMDSDAARV